jgi:hypothetical protein
MISRFVKKQKLNLLKVKVIYRFSWFILRCKISHEKNIEFAQAWAFVTRSNTLVELAKDITDKYQNTGYELIFHILSKATTKIGLNFKPKLHLLSDITIDAGGLFVGVHTGLSPMYRFALENDYQPIGISRKHNSLAQAQRLTGIRKMKNEISPPDNTSLLKIRKLLKNQKIVIATTDYRDKQREFTKVSDAMFKMASKLKFPLYLFASTIGSNGQIILVIQGPLLGSPEEVMKRFIKLQKHTRLGEVTYTFQ